MSDCKELKNQYKQEKLNQLNKEKQAQLSSLFNTSGLTLLSENLLAQLSTVLDEAFVHAIEDDLLNNMSVSSYVGAVISAYLVALTSIPNLLLVLPYVTIQNLKKYLKIRIESVDYTFSLLNDLERLLSRIPLEAGIPGRNINDLNKAIQHISKCLVLLDLYKKRLAASLEVNSGYITPSLFNKALKELDQSIHIVGSYVERGAVVTGNLSDQEADKIFNDFENDLQEHIGDYGTKLVKSYIKQYGVYYLLVLKFIKKLQFNDKTSLNEILNAALIGTVAVTQPNGSTLDFASASISSLYQDNPVFSATAVTPIINIYIKSLTTLLKSFSILENSTSLLSSILPAAFVPIDSAEAILKRVRNELQDEVETSSKSIMRNASLEFSKLYYLSELEASKQLLLGYNPNSRRPRNNTNTLEKTINALKALKNIEDYLNDGYPKPEEHPINELNENIFRLTTVLIKTLGDVNSRGNVKGIIKKLKLICKTSNRYDHKLLFLLEAYKIDETQDFREALDKYERLTSGLDAIQSINNSALFNPIVSNFGRAMTFGLTDALVTALSINPTIPQAQSGLSSLGNLINNVLEQKCIESDIARELSEPSLVDQEETIINNYYKNEVAKLERFDEESLTDAGWTKYNILT